MPVDRWEELLTTFLHDPPDKVLSRKDHERRSATYLAVLGIQASVGGSEADDVASSIERPLLPKRKDIVVEPDDDGKLKTKHPMSAEERILKLPPLQEDKIEEIIKDIAKDKKDLKTKFFALWRLLPEKLAELDETYSHLPADTRVPDHTIWNHLDITAALSHAPHNSSLLFFKIGRAQSFIASARTLRDLWTGSMLLSYMTFKAMEPVVNELGPTAIVYPALRGLPVMDAWLSKNFGLAGLEKTQGSAVQIPCVPNKFLAVVPCEGIDISPEDLASKCEDAARRAWKDCCDRVRSCLNEKLENLPGGKGWDVRWDKQVDNFWEIRTVVLPWKELDQKDLEPIEKLLECISSRTKKWEEFVKTFAGGSKGIKRVGSWQMLTEFVARLMEANSAVRHIPPSASVSPTGLFPPKCTMFYTYEQMGPDGLDESRDFWEKARDSISVEGVRLRKGERLSAVGLVKRFAGPVYLQKELGIGAPRYPDTATVAAASWLKMAKLDPDAIRKQYHCWSGPWLYWRTSDFDKNEDPCPKEVWELIEKARRPKDEGGWGLPPAYYAVLAMDADEMGKWLRGEKSPAIREKLHPYVVERLEKEYSEHQQAFSVPRPITPAMHAAISEALTNFAARIAPGIVEKHDGTLIYAGGDDLLALLPARTALACALELYGAFRGERCRNGGTIAGWYRQGKQDLLTMGQRATLSAGIAIVHWKENLGDALRVARQAEKTAKDRGRNALALTICRRSGERASALCTWPMIPTLEGWIRAFEAGASDRWAYHLSAEAETLWQLPDEAVKAEIKRQVNRAEKETRELLGEGQDMSAGDIIAEAFGSYLKVMKDRAESAEKRGERSSVPEGMCERFLVDFLTLVQSASFIARGRDE